MITDTEKQAIFKAVNDAGFLAFKESYVPYDPAETDVAEITHAQLVCMVYEPFEGETLEYIEDIGDLPADDFLGISCIAHCVRNGEFWSPSVDELVGNTVFPLYVAARNDIGQAAVEGLPETGALAVVFVVRQA